MQYTALRRGEGSKIKNIQKVKNFCYAFFLKKKGSKFEFGHLKT